MKTHDYHRLLQHIIPIAIIGLGSSKLWKAIWSLGKLLRWVCSKTIDEKDIEDMETLAAEVVCELEAALPPSFFDCQIHLMVHLVQEIAIAGPVHARWMYWVERYMGVLKRHVQNRARVEGSIAEGHLASESMFYCTNIISTIDPKAPRAWLEVDIDAEKDRLTGARKERQLTTVEVKQITSMMLCNSLEASKWTEFYEEEKRNAPRRRIYPSFQVYLKAKLREIDELIQGGNSISHYPEVSDHLRTLVMGPLLTVNTRSAMWSKGRHFCIAELDDKRFATQDCGVMCQFTQDFRSSHRDRNMVR